MAKTFDFIDEDNSDDAIIMASWGGGGATQGCAHLRARWADKGTSNRSHLRFESPFLGLQV